MGRSSVVAELSHPAIQRVVDAAARKGIPLDIQLMPETTHTAEEAAAAVEADLGQIVKSLIFVAPRSEGRLALIICLVSGRNQADIDLLNAVTGEVAIRRATAREARELTGFSIGGIPPLGYGRDVRILMDPDLCQYQWIWAAAGTDTAVFKVAPLVLQMLSNAVVAPFSQAPWSRAAAAPAVESRLQFEAGAGA
jgi:prolyl-tRNA editing enzyme YbaK/EbsC (Cys-tRNA(Pro) deacylase)